MESKTFIVYVDCCGLCRKGKMRLQVLLVNCLSLKDSRDGRLSVNKDKKANNQIW